MKQFLIIGGIPFRSYTGTETSLDTVAISIHSSEEEAKQAFEQAWQTHYAPNIICLQIKDNKICIVSENEQ